MPPYKPIIPAQRRTIAATTIGAVLEWSDLPAFAVRECGAAR